MILAPNIDTFWLRISARVDRIRRALNQTWTTTDVCEALIAKRAFLYTSTDGESFTIVYPKVGNSGENVLWVWLAWGKNGFRAENVEILMELARGIGAKWLMMESPRVGFLRTGWEPIEDGVYRMKVTEG